MTSAAEPEHSSLLASAGRGALVQPHCDWTIPIAQDLEESKRIEATPRPQVQDGFAGPKRRERIGITTGQPHVRALGQGRQFLE